MSMLHSLKASLLIAAFASTPGSLAAQARVVPAPMVDGRCDEYMALGAHRYEVADGVTLRVHEDDHYFWLCYDVPPGSMGLLDMRVESKALPESLNLHVSAQLGEWPADHPERAPQTADSDQWWRFHGWIANAAWFNGFDVTNTPPSPRFQDAPGRELQLAKARFGAQPRILLKIRLRGADRRFQAISFPADGRLHALGKQSD